MTVRKLGNSWWVDLRFDKRRYRRRSPANSHAGAKAYEALNNPAKATSDFRRATQLAPVSVFEAMAQAESKRKIQELSKKVPCGGGGQRAGTCL